MICWFCRILFLTDHTFTMCCSWMLSACPEQCQALLTSTSFAQDWYFWSSGWFSLSLHSIQIDFFFFTSVFHSPLPPSLLPSCLAFYSTHVSVTSFHCYYAWYLKIAWHQNRVSWGPGHDCWASLVVQRVKRLPAMWKTWYQSWANLADVNNAWWWFLVSFDDPSHVSYTTGDSRSSRKGWFLSKWVQPKESQKLWHTA